MGVSVSRGPLWRPGPRDLLPEGLLDLGLALRSQATAPKAPPRGPLLLGLVVRARIRACVGRVGGECPTGAEPS